MFRWICRLRLIVGVAFSVSFVSWLRADTLTLAPAADGYIRAIQSTSQTSNTSNLIFFVGDTATANDFLRAVLAFDLSSPVLKDVIINSVSLVCTVHSRDTASGGSADGLQTVELRALGSSFTEADVSWTQRNASSAWSVPGGDFGQVIATSTGNPATVNAGDTLSFSSADLTSSVSAALGGSCYLLGKLASEDGIRSVFRFASRHGATPPQLVIDYTRVNPSVTPVPGHPERAASTRYTLTAGAKPVEVKAERFGFDVAMFTLGQEPAEVSVTVNGSFTDYTLKPARHVAGVIRDGNTLRFTLGTPQKLVLEIPGMTPLAIIVTPPETGPPAPNDPSVVYYGPGVTVAGAIRPSTGQTIYLAPGALVKGRIEIKGVSDVTVLGRGILETEGYAVWADKTHGILVENSRNVRIEGISVRNYGSHWQTLFLNSSSILLDDLNIFGIGKNTDGVDIDGVKDFVVCDSFVRGEDDGFGWHSLDAVANGEVITERVLADNVVIWNTVAGNGVRIGASMETQLWRDITLRNIDILLHAGAGLYSDFSDWGWMQSLRFENINIERAASPINFRILKTIYTNSNGFLDARGSIEGLLFENITLKGGTVRLEGFDAAHRINHVRFNNCLNAGVPLVSTAQLAINAFVTDIAFNQPLPDKPAPLPGIYEVEDLESSTNRLPQYIADDAGSSRGKHRAFLASGPGDYVEHTISVPAAGTYQIKIRVRQTPASGRARLTVNGLSVAEECDFYSAAISYHEFDCGFVTIPASGPVALRLTSTGRDAESSGFQLEVDAFKILTPLEVWRDHYFQTTANNGMAADSADPDGDSATNLLEFATGASPVDTRPPAVNGIFNAEGGLLALSFLRLSPAPVTYVCEASDNLAEWTPVATLPAGSDTWIGLAGVAETTNASGVRAVTVTAPLSINSNSRRFLRLCIQAP